jgi:hypothetical protein
MSISFDDVERGPGSFATSRPETTFLPDPERRRLSVLPSAVRTIGRYEKPFRPAIWLRNLERLRTSDPDLFEGVG